MRKRLVLQQTCVFALITEMQCDQKVTVFFLSVNLSKDMDWPARMECPGDMRSIGRIGIPGRSQSRLHEHPLFPPRDSFETIWLARLLINRGVCHDTVYI